MKTRITYRDFSAYRFLSSIVASTHLSVAVLLVGIGLITGCSEPAPSGGISEPDPELVFVRGYRSADDDCKLTGEFAVIIS